MQERQRKMKFLGMVAKMYNEMLRCDIKSAFNYLQKRRITKKLVEEFSLGFSNPFGNYEFLYDNKETSLELGLLYKGKDGMLRPYFLNRLMFPFYDAQGNCLGFTGRDIGGVSKAKYLNSKESDIFQKSIAMYGYYQSYERIHRMKQIFIVEGNIDVLRMYENGYPVIGLSSHEMSEYQIKILLTSFPDIYLLLDGDESGKNGAIKITQIYRDMYKKGVKTRLPKLIQLPDGYDPDKFFLEYSEPEDYINEQIWEGKFAPYPRRSENYYRSKNFVQGMKERSSDPHVVKAMNNIVDIIGSRIQLKRSGANWICRCPFHDERTESFVVSEDKQFFKCFGCGISGDVFTFLMKYDQIGFYKAMEILGGTVK